MVRNYKRKTATAYDSDTLSKALAEIKSGTITPYRASKKYKINATTLRRKSRALDPFVGPGRPRALDCQAEESIVKVVKCCSQLGCPMSSEDLCNLVQSLVTTAGIETPFKQDRPGKDWASNFIQRHSDDIIIRDPEMVSFGRGQSLNEVVLVDAEKEEETEVVLAEKEEEEESTAGPSVEVVEKLFEAEKEEEITADRTIKLKEELIQAERKITSLQKRVIQLKEEIRSAESSAVTKTVQQKNYSAVPSQNCSAPTVILPWPQGGFNTQ